MGVSRRFGVRKLLDCVASLLNGIGVLLIALLILWVGCDVTSRGLFEAPIPGTVEAVKAGTVAIAFLCFFYTLRQGRMVRADLVARRLPQQAQQALCILESIIGIVVFAIIARYSWDGAWAGFLVGESEGAGIMIPVYPARFAIVLSSFLLSLQYLLHLIRDIKTLFTLGGTG